MMNLLFTYLSKKLFKASDMAARENIFKEDRWVARLRNLPRIARLAHRRSVSWTSFRLFREYSFLPQEVLFFLTYRCNLRCRMCGQWGEEGYVRKGAPEILKDELPFDALKPTFDDLATFKPRVFLCGGEIFLYPQWREVLYYLNQKGLGTTIITNGTRLQEASSDILGSRVEQISLSLDGTSEIHDDIRGSTGTFHRVQEGIEAVLAARSSHRSYYPRLVINSTLTDLNYASLIRFLETVEHSGVDSVTLLHFNFIDSNLWEHHEKVFKQLFGGGCPHWKGFVYDSSKIDLDEFIAIIGEVKRRRFSIPVYFMPEYNEEEIRNYYSGKRFYPQHPRGVCKGPWNTVNVLPNGDISPCLDVVVGNIQEDGGLLKAWNGPTLQRFRRILKDEGLFPACTRCCTYYRF